jgi:cytoplasmic iron level regulating protein YaaA (DUF328/UPF0246 family)
MIVVLSPAKTLDFDTPPVVATHSQPGLLDQSQILIDRLRQLSPLAIGQLMGISDQLAALNATRFAQWSLPFRPANAKQAVLAFNGDVYEGLDAATLTPADLKFAQRHLRILSGLYGLLRPLDLIQAYRLEMGSALANPRGKDLYAFWGERIVDEINSALVEAKASALINLASQEYFRSIKSSRLAAPVIEPVFEDWSTGQGKYKVVSFYAKRARGLMTRFVLSARIKSPQGLKAFAMEGYGFCDEASTAARWVFRRKSAQRE